MGGSPSGWVPTAHFPRAWVMQEVQEYLIEDSDPEAEDALAQPPGAGPTPQEQGGEDAGTGL